MEIRENYTRVTDPLSMFGKFDQIDPEVLRNAAERGTNIHLAISGYLADLGAVFDHKSYELYFKSVKSWLDERIFLPQPERWYDDELMLTGECDAIYQDDNDLVLVDFKCTYMESKTWKLQGSAYAYLARKNGYAITRVEFVRLKRDGKPCVVYTYKEDFELYKKVLDVYRYFH